MVSLHVQDNNDSFHPTPLISGIIRATRSSSLSWGTTKKLALPLDNLTWGTSCCFQNILLQKYHQEYWTKSTCRRRLAHLLVFPEDWSSVSSKDLKGIKRDLPGQEACEKNTSVSLRPHLSPGTLGPGKTSQFRRMKSDSRTFWPYLSFASAGVLVPRPGSTLAYIMLVWIPLTRSYKRKYNKCQILSCGHIKSFRTSPGLGPQPPPPKKWYCNCTKCHTERGRSSRKVGHASPFW